MKKNIYHFVADFKFGGVEVAARSSIEELNLDNNFYIVCVGKVHDYFINTLGENEKRQILELNYRSLSIFKQLFLFILLLKKNPPDIFLFSLWKASLIGLVLRFFYKKTVFISFIHSTKFFHKLDKYFSEQAINKFDLVFVDSNSTKEFVLQHNANVNITIISFLMSRYLGQIKSINENKINFLYLGRISKIKRLDKSLDVIYRLLNKNLNVTYNIYGKDDGELINIKNKIKELNLENNVFIHEPVDPNYLSEVFDKHQFYLQLSDDEGMAMSVCEAMQNGLVCCITPVGEIKKYSVDMDSAIHLNEDNIENFVGKILMAIEEKNTFNNISQNSLKQWNNIVLYKDDLKMKINEIMIKWKGKLQ